jgi:hypothetical protein
MFNKVLGMAFISTFIFGCVSTKPELDLPYIIEPNVEFYFYDIEYDDEGVVEKYSKKTTIDYGTPTIIQILFSGIEDNNFVKISVLDNENNICFEVIKEIINGEINVKCNFLTTRDILSRLNSVDAILNFKCKINIMNKYYFESNTILVNIIVEHKLFALKGFLRGDPIGKFILRSTDGEYEQMLDALEDGVQRDRYISLKYYGVFPDKYYSLFYRELYPDIYNNSIEVVHEENKPFYELFKAIDDNMGY